MGDAPEGYDRLTLVWHASEGQDGWTVEMRPAGGAWTPVAPPAAVPVALSGTSIPPYRVWSAQLTPLAPGASYEYRVLGHGLEVFPPTGFRARKGPGQPQRVAVVGDLAEGTQPSLRVARRIQVEHPDLLVGVGDLVYAHGTVGEYRTRFFPAFNGDAGEPGAGAPLMRGTLMVGVLGNHDVAHVGRRRVPPRDSLAYFHVWDQPCNGPDLAAGGHVPNLSPAGDWAGFRTAAGNRFPHMANFTFRTGDVQWIVLDSNRYVHWNRKDVRAWLKQELAKARDATWRFVVYHHPAFNLSTYKHTDDWHMRELWPLFQRYHVDLVFSGHMHTYNRTRPVAFTPVPAGTRPAAHCASEANILVDHGFDGRTNTRAQYPIQILTGAGGGFLHHPTLPDPPKPFTAAAVDRHGFSLLDIDGRRLEFRQVDTDGHVVDAFTLTK